MSPDVFALFLDSRVALGCADATINWYRYQARLFTTWLTANDKTYNTIKLIDLQQYQAYLRESYSPSTVRQATTSIITLYRWLMEVELISINPAARLKRPRTPDKMPPSMSFGNLNRILSAIDFVTWIDYRDHLLLQLLFYTGVRTGECVGLKVADVDLDTRRLKLWRKGGKERFHPFPRLLLNPLHEWLTVHRPRIREPCLFPSAQNGGVRGSLTKPGLHNMLQRRADAAGVPFVSAHGYRHGFALWMLERGASTRLVQELLGHSGIQTTERYLRLTPDQTQRMLDALFGEML